MSKHKWANQSAKTRSLPVSAIERYRQLPEEKQEEIRAKILREAPRIYQRLNHEGEENE